jgi:CMP-N,N'-diacetyllegionaminic acid synthase
LKTLALIPARGGSKGIPNKNLQIVGNKSLVSRAIESAVRADIFDEICVSTDSKEVAEEVQRDGLRIPFFRPKELSLDTTLGIDVVKHAINHYKSIDMNFETVVILQPTSPFRTFENVQIAHRIFTSSSCQSLISVLDVTNFHSSTLYSRANQNESLSSIELGPFDRNFENSSGTLRQQFPKTYWRNGAIYILKTCNLLDSVVLLKEPIFGYVMPWIQSINIDTHEDLSIAKLLAENLSL